LLIFILFFNEIWGWFAILMMVGNVCCIMLFALEKDMTHWWERGLYVCIWGGKKKCGRVGRKERGLIKRGGVCRV